MQFGAAASAFASQAGDFDGIGHDGRVLGTTSNLLHRKHHQWHPETITTTDRLESVPVDIPSATKVLKNKRARHQLASTIIGKLEDLRKVVECDPRAEIVQDQRLKNHPEDEKTVTNFVDSAEEDLGILSPSCGVGRKCRDGRCVDVEGRFRYRALQAENSTTGLISAMDDSSSNGIATNSSDARPENSTTIVDSMLYACEYGSLVGYNCTCNFMKDSTYYTGSATCITPKECATETSVCGVNVTDCYQTTYSLVLQGEPGVWDAELCLKFLEPYEQTVCYETSTLDFAETILPECTISLDGEQCNDCDVYAFRDDNCYNFDCGNTVLAGNGRGSMAGNTCSLPAHTVGLYLDTFGCPPCYLCGEDMTMRSPANTMELFNTTYQCAYVQDVALQGFFTTDSCEYFGRIAREPCGCSDGSAPMPSVVSGNQTTEMNESSDSPSADPGEMLLCNICPEGTVTPGGVFVMPGSQEVSCSDLEAAGLNGTIVGAESCEAFQDRAAGPCCGAPFSSDEPIVDESTDGFCTVCGPNKTLTDDTSFVSVPTQGIYSCKELIAMGQNGTLDDKRICILVQLSAKTPCGCISDDPTAAPVASTIPPSDSEETIQGSGAAARFSRTASLAALAAVAVASNLPW